MIRFSLKCLLTLVTANYLYGELNAVAPGVAPLLKQGLASITPPPHTEWDKEKMQAAAAVFQEQLLRLSVALAGEEGRDGEAKATLILSALRSVDEAPQTASERET